MHYIHLDKLTDSSDCYPIITIHYYLNFGSFNFFAQGDNKIGFLKPITIWDIQDGNDEFSYVSFILNTNNTNYVREPIDF